MSDKINAWIHWVKLNPINDDQLLFAIEVEKLKKENEVLRKELSELSFLGSNGVPRDPETVNYVANKAKAALEQADKIREGK